jgi:hypothetical protein
MGSSFGGPLVQPLDALQDLLRFWGDIMVERTLMEMGECLTRFGHKLNRIRRQLRGAGLLKEAESVQVAARECWRAGRLIERKPTAAERFSEYVISHPMDDEPDDDDLNAELDRLFSRD